MSAQALQHSLDRMRRSGLPEAALTAFTARFEQLARGEDGLIPEDTLTPLLAPPSLDDVPADPDSDLEALRATAVVRLNGGLGTSMGLDGPKCLIRVRGDMTFLDIVVEQTLTARARTGARLPLLLLNSFATRDDTLAALEAYPGLPVAGLPLNVLQSQEPKIRADNLEPVDHPADPDLEWCPPGHGDLYPTLWSSGILDALLESGLRYLFVANIDNLGATADARVAGWFARTGAPYAAEITRRTPMDRKGGHLAVRRADGRLILRDTAQTPPDEMVYHTDERRHPFAHCNSLWFDLAALAGVLGRSGGVLDLPLIANRKTVDPADAASTPVIQLETAMGTAIEFFSGAQAIAVPRSRFLPVKTTDELLLLRSDAFRFTDDAELLATASPLPVVTLDPRHYRRIDDFEARFPDGAPSLREAERLTVRGDWSFGGGVTVRGDVTLPDEGRPGRLEPGAVLGGASAT